MAVNGRPWFVFYDPALSGVAHVGGFMVPFQPSNEAEELFLQSTPWNYKEFPSKAAATAWINSPAGKKIIAENGKTPGGTGQNITGGISGTVGATENIASDLGKAGAWAGKKSNWIRVLKVGIGSVLVIAGLLHLTKGEDQIVKAATKVAGSAAII